MRRKFTLFLVFSATCIACGAEDPRVQALAQSAESGPTVSVVPASELEDHQSVAVHGTGLPANTAVIVAQCPVGAFHIVNDCGQWFAQTATSRSDGTVDVTLTVTRGFIVFPSFVNCERPATCVVAVAAQATPTQLYKAPIEFRPPMPSATVTPNSELSDLQVVEVSAKELSYDFVPEYVSVAQCRTGAVIEPGNPSWPSDCIGVASTSTNSGAISLPVTVQYIVRPYNAAPFSCEGAGACSIAVKTLFTRFPVATAPISFRTMGTPKAGVVQLQPSSVNAGAPVTVMGSGWAFQSTVLISTCAKGSDPATCRLEKNLALDTSGAFSTTVPTTRFVEYQTGMVDCTVPGACVVTVQDSRDPENTTAEAPLTLQVPPVQGGSASMQAVPLIDTLPVRLTGAGWAAARLIRIMQCHGADFSACRQLDPALTDGAGAFRRYPELAEMLFGRPDLNCGAAPGACSLVVADDNALTATQVRIPLTFTSSTQFTLTSHYDSEHEALLQQGVSASGLLPDTLQKTGAAGTVWLLNYARLATGAHFSTSGTFSHASSYTRAEYLIWTRAAARFDYTLEELQKTGALFWSWLLAGRPPFPDSDG